ncbi:LuxR family transcriptional regulator [Sphingobium sp. SCG-1]|uniref:response regulator transcription factor n=1 Tax=Sphingobium sp. SCG-1 TaxID=2072936 RepID=UPI000CD68664|nr:response regulator [Sphingobium sp. SCG-1]AUW56947.1 LuxR family transcriptional regulator [Sphingobium sp. SCG-1]
MSDLLRKLFLKGAVANAVTRRLRLLVVEENADTRSIIGRRLSHMGYDVALAEGGPSAMSLLSEQHFDLVLIDASIATAGIATLRKMQASGLMEYAGVLLIIGRADSAAMIEALDAGADDTIVKPFDFDVLDARIRHIVSRARCVADLKRQNAQLDARVALRAVELGEARSQIAELSADRGRYADSILTLKLTLDSLNAARA